MATEVATLALKADTSDLVKAEKALNSVAAAGKKADASAGGYTKAADGAAVSSQKLRGVAGQLGFQVQDIAVQLQSGTNALTVFGQQGSQIAGAFGPGGAVLGAVIAIGAAVGTALVASFGNATSSAEDLRKELEELTEGFDELGEAARVVYIREATVQLAEQEEQLAKTGEAMREAAAELDKLQDADYRLAQQMSAYTTDVLADAEAQAQDLAKAYEEQSQAIQDQRDQLDLLTGAKREENAETKRQIEDVARYVERMKEQAETLGFNNEQMARYKAAQLGANAAQTEAIALSARRIDQHKEEIEAQRQAAAIEKEREQQAKTKARADEALKAAQQKKAETELEQNNQRAEQIAESLLREEEQIALSYERRSEIILNSTRMTEQQVTEALAGLELERQDKLKAIKDKAAAEDAARSAQTTHQLLAFEDVLLQGKSEKQKTAYRLAVNLASAEKRQNAAKIVSDSYAAAMGAYKALAGIPIIGPALGAGAAALILGAGVSYAAKSLTGRALGGQVRGGESYVVGERGPEVLTMGGNGGRIIPNDKLKGESTQQTTNANVTFQISTVDAEGFDDLLQTRRGQIVEMINSALYDQGRGALA